MAVCDLIFGIYCHGESFDRREVQAANLLHVSVRVFDSVHRHFEREIEDQEKRENQT